MREQTPLEKELESEVYVNRMLILLETDDGFAQVFLTPKHFKSVSDAIARGFTLVSKDGPHETIDMLLGDERLPPELFEGMRDFYEEDLPEA